MKRGGGGRCGPKLWLRKNSNKSYQIVQAAAVAGLAESVSAVAACGVAWPGSGRARSSSRTRSSGGSTWSSRAGQWHHQQGQWRSMCRAGPVKRWQQLHQLDHTEGRGSRTKGCGPACTSFLKEGTESAKNSTTSEMLWHHRRNTSTANDASIKDKLTRFISNQDSTIYYKECLPYKLITHTVPRLFWLRWHTTNAGGWFGIWSVSTK